MKEEEKNSDNINREGLLEKFKEKEERKKTIRRVQREMTIKHKLLEDATPENNKLSLDNLDSN